MITDSNTFTGADEFLLFAHLHNSDGKNTSGKNFIKITGVGMGAMKQESI